MRAGGGVFTLAVIILSPERVIWITEKEMEVTASAFRHVQNAADCG